MCVGRGEPCFYWPLFWTYSKLTNVPTWFVTILEFIGGGNSLCMGVVLQISKHSLLESFHSGDFSPQHS